MIVAGSVAAQAVQTLLEANQVPLALADIWFGDQLLLPRTPAACVIVGNTTTVRAGAPNRVRSVFEVQVLVYHCKLQDAQVTELEVSQRAEAVVTLLNQAATFSGELLDGLCIRIEPGYVNKSGTFYKTSRVTWEGTSLPYFSTS